MPELLSSKIIIREEPPQIRSITALPTAVLGMIGITQRGPVGQPVLVLSFEEWRNTFGGYTLTSRDTIAAVEGFFEEGGQFLWFTRTVHYTDVTDNTTSTSTRGSVDLSTLLLAAQGAQALSTLAGPFSLPDGATITTSEDGNAAVTTTINGGPAQVTAVAAGNVALADGQTLTLRVNNGPEQTLTLQAASFANIAAATPAEVATVISAFTGATGDVDGTSPRLSTDGAGNGFSIQVTGGTANAVLQFPTTVQNGTGNVGNLAAISNAELISLVEAATTGLSGSEINSRLAITTDATGAAKTLTIGGTAAATLGLPTAEQTGADAVAATPTLRVQGRWDGAYTDDLTVSITAASSGEADRFNLVIRESGVIRETWANLSMLDTDPNYVETVINAEIPAGSVYITVTDLDAGLGSPTNDRPATLANTAIPGGGDGLVGIADTDFIGDVDEKTGLYALDADNSQPITLLASPARITAVVHNAMLTYAEIHRNGSMLALIDAPAGSTAQGIVDYVREQALLEGASEFGALYWPHVRVINPNTTLFGDQDYITIPPCGHVAGAMARTDASQPGGVYLTPAGQENGRLRSIVGFEILPGRQIPESFDETKRDLVVPARVNPLDANGGLRIIDGARTLRADGSFPFVGERRGVIFIEQSVKAGIEFARFANHDARLRAEVARVIDKFLADQMSVGAFRTRNPETAYFVDVGEGLNPPSVVFNGELRARIGLATQKPAEFITLTFTQDTRALTQELSQ